MCKGNLSKFEEPSDYDFLIEENHGRWHVEQYLGAKTVGVVNNTRLSHRTRMGGESIV